MPKKSYPLAKVYGLLEPGPLLSCVVSNRNYSFDLLMATRECAIHIPTAEIAEQVVQCGNVSGATVDKFLQTGLTPVAAKIVGAPLIAECYAKLECRVVDIGGVKKYAQFVLEVVKAWCDPAVTAARTLHHLGYGKFMVAGDIIQLKSTMR